MINEFSVSPKPQNNSAKIVCAALLSTFAALVVCYMTLNRFRGVIGLAAIVFLTVGIMIYTRYLAVKYYYDITFDSSSRAVLSVRQVTGKRQTTLCCIYLSSIESVTRQTREEKKAHKTPFGMRKYNYTPTLIPDVTHLVVSSSRIEKCEIRLEITDEYAAMLREYVSEAKELAKLAEENDPF